MTLSTSGVPWLLAVLAGGVTLACKSGEAPNAEVGPICPSCVAGGESSDFSGGTYPPQEDRCEVYLVVSQPLDADADTNDARLVQDVRRRLNAAAASPFQWSASGQVQSGAPATGYDPNVISVETEFEFGETFVEQLDPAQCASGYCFHQGGLIRCALRDERWLRQDFAVRLKTSDQAIDARLEGSGRITMDGHFATGRYVSGGEPQAYASDVEGTLRIAPSEPGDPRLWAQLALFGAELRGNVVIRHETWSDISNDYFPPYVPLSGSWPTTDECGSSAVATNMETPSVLLGGRAPGDLLAAVKAGSQGTQNASWEDGRAEVVQVEYGEPVAEQVCLSRQSVAFPRQRVSATAVESDINVTWHGLTILHETGEVAGFQSHGRFEYDAEEEHVGEELAGYQQPPEDRLTLDVFLSDAKANFDSGYGGWTGTAFPAWDLNMSRSAWVGCSEAGCDSVQLQACLGTNEHGYNTCDSLIDLPVVPINLSDVVTRIFSHQPTTGVTPAVPSIAPTPPGVNPEPTLTSQPGVSSVTPDTPMPPRPGEDGDAGLPSSAASSDSPADAAAIGTDASF